MMLGTLALVCTATVIYTAIGSPRGFKAPYARLNQVSARVVALTYKTHQRPLKGLTRGMVT